MMVCLIALLDGSNGSGGSSAAYAAGALKGLGSGFFLVIAGVVAVALIFAVVMVHLTGKRISSRDSENDNPSITHRDAPRRSRTLQRKPANGAGD